MVNSCIVLSVDVFGIEYRFCLPCLSFSPYLPPFFFIRAAAAVPLVRDTHDTPT